MKKIQICLLVITFITNLNAQDYFTQAYNAYFNADLKKAEELYTKYLGNYPNGFSAYYNRGLALFYQEKYGKAKKDFEQSIKLCPNGNTNYISDAQKKIKEINNIFTIEANLYSNKSYNFRTYEQ